MDYRSITYLLAFKKTGQVTISEFPTDLQDFAYRAIGDLEARGLVKVVRDEDDEIESADLTLAGMQALQRFKD